MSEKVKRNTTGTMPGKLLSLTKLYSTIDATKISMMALKQYDKLLNLAVWLAKNRALHDKRKAELFLYFWNKIDINLRAESIEIPIEIKQYVAEVVEIYESLKVQTKASLENKKRGLIDHYRDAEEYEALWDITHDSQGVQFSADVQSQTMLSMNSDEYKSLKNLEKAYKSYRESPTLLNEFNVRELIEHIKMNYKKQQTKSAGDDENQITEHMFNYARRVEQRLNKNALAAQDKITELHADAAPPAEEAAIDMPPPPGALGAGPNTQMEIPPPPGPRTDDKKKS